MLILLNYILDQFLLIHSRKILQHIYKLLKRELFIIQYKRIVIIQYNVKKIGKLKIKNNKLIILYLLLSFVKLSII